MKFLGGLCLDKVVSGRIPTCYRDEGFSRDYRTEVEGCIARVFPDYTCYYENGTDIYEYREFWIGFDTYCEVDLRIPGDKMLELAKKEVTLIELFMASTTVISISKVAKEGYKPFRDNGGILWYVEVKK